MQKQSQIVQARIHVVKLVVENCLCMDPEADILISIELDSEHIACAVDKFWHAICKGRITGLEISNGVDKGFAGFDELLKELPISSIANHGVDYFGRNR